MHGLDVELTSGMTSQMARMDAGRSPGANADTAPMVDVDPVGCRRRKFVPVERGVHLRDDRPRVRVGSRLAGEVPGVEFLEGGVDVVEVERDGGDDPVVGVDLDDGEHLGGDLPGPVPRIEERNANEGEALARGSQ